MSPSASPSVSGGATKILVAIHGIGNQTAYATVQSVAAQLGNYYDIGAPIPLGRFYTAGGTAAGPVPILMAPPDPDALVGFGFAEAYWAGIPRGVAESGFVLEQTKRWARTVIGRMVLRAAQTKQPLPDREQVRLMTVLDEMIETIAVLERLNLLAAKAGLFEFKLQTLLRDFVGDVQVVADFPTYRAQILKTVDDVMTAGLKLGDGKPTELYVVAHSEGSVVAFLALLTAIANPKQYPWIESTRGLMTIGSPIETHHLLWPELWRDVPALRPAKSPNLGKIVWHNYYDSGDPIAYPLKTTTKWLNDSSVGFGQYLTPVETEFSRYRLPGKAHNDYWHDRELFAHFIEKVVGAKRREGAPPAAVPRNKQTARILSYAVPYLLVVALLWLATYFLYRPVVTVVAAVEPTTMTIFQDVLGIALLLLGMTAAARIPRLTNGRVWWLVAAGVFAAGATAYWKLVAGASRESLGLVFTGGSADPVSDATRGIVITAAGVALLCGIFANWRPTWGAKILPISGLVAALLLVFHLIAADKDNTIEIWPMALGAAAFFYLWWIATLLFDLVFVWHWFVRHATTAASLSEICEKGYTQTKTEKFVHKCDKKLQERRARRADQANQSPA
jgi:hypothetical protein